MEFGNPIIGLEELIRSAIRSKNFESGVSGWRISREGDAEFNAIIIRGTIGDAIIIGPSSGSQVIVNVSGGSARLLFPTNSPTEDIAARIASAIDFDGTPTEVLALGINGPSVVADETRMRIVLTSQNASGATPQVSFNREIAGVDALVANIREDNTGVDRFTILGRITAEPPGDSSNSALFVSIPATYSGNWIRVQKNGTDRLRYDPNGYWQLARALADDDVIGVGVDGDTFNRLNIEADGTIGWGSGSAASDVAFARSGVGTMTLTGQIDSYDGDAFTTYTPVVTNGGTVTWTTRTGRWQRVGKMIYFNAYLNVNAAGSGAGILTITGPVDIARTTRQSVAVHLDNVTAAREGTGIVLAFDSGSGSAFDRIRGRDNVNLTGADLLAGAHITVEGWYREA